MELSILAKMEHRTLARVGPSLQLQSPKRTYIYIYSNNTISFHYAKNSSVAPSLLFDHFSLYSVLVLLLKLASLQMLCFFILSFFFRFFICMLIEVIINRRFIIVHSPVFLDSTSHTKFYNQRPSYHLMIKRKIIYYILTVLRRFNKTTCVNFRICLTIKVSIGALQKTKKKCQ